MRGKRRGGGGGGDLAFDEGGGGLCVHTGVCVVVRGFDWWYY